MTQVRRLAAAALIALAPIGLVIIWLVVRDELPDTLATHFGLDGTPDGFSRTDRLLPGFGGVVFVVTLLGWVAVVLVRNRQRAWFVVPMMGFVAWMFAGSAVDVMLSARGVADPADIRSGWVHTLLVTGSSFCMLFATAALLRPPPLPPVSAGELTSYRLAPGERAMWVGEARSRGFAWSGAFLFLIGVAGVVLRFWPSLVALILGAALLAVRGIRVRADERGVRARMGLLPSRRIALDQIDSARVEEIEPMQWGGWGYRLSSRGVGMVVRKGPGIVLRLNAGRDLAITVDDAETGAALINGLIAARSR